MLFFLLFAAHRLHLLIPAFLLQGLHCKESADCNNGQVVNNTANIQNTVHKVIHMACHVEYTEQILDFALEKGGFCEVNCRQRTLADHGNHTGNDRVLIILPIQRHTSAMMIKKAKKELPAPSGKKFAIPLST